MSNLVEHEPINLRPNLAHCQLGDELFVFSEESQHLIGLNPSAAFVFRELQSGTKTTAELNGALVSAGVAERAQAEEWVTITVESLVSNGMLAGGCGSKAHSENPVEADSQASRIAKVPPFEPFTPVVERRYRLLGTCAVMRFAMAEQAKRVDAAIGHLAADSGEPSMVFDIQGISLGRRGPIRSYIYRNHQPADLATGLHRLAPVVKGHLWGWAVNAHDYLFYIHAGVVGADDACILLPAAAGSGKSSLTAALTHSGLRYLSDEVALLERGTFQVPPVPLAICAKRSGWPVMARYYPEILTTMTHERIDGKVVRYVPPPPGAIEGSKALVSHIIFPRYSEEAATELRPVGKGEALRRLMDECLRHQRLSSTDFSELLRWFSGIECYSLTYSSLDRAVELVRDVIKA